VLKTEKEDDWREPFLAFLLDQHVPEDKAEWEALRDIVPTTSWSVTTYTKKTTSTGILMKCILRSEG
jgi:hypothetical protein